MGSVHANANFSPGFTFGQQIAPTLEPFYNLNANQDWSNFNFWSPSLVSLDAGMATAAESHQRTQAEKELVVNSSHAPKDLTTSTQSSTKGKMIEKDLGNSKGKKQAGVNK